MRATQFTRTVLKKINISQKKKALPFSAMDFYSAMEFLSSCDHMRPLSDKLSYWELRIGSLFSSQFSELKSDDADRRSIAFFKLSI